MPQDTFDLHQEELDYLQKLGFATNFLNSSANNLEEIWEKAMEIKTQKENLNYPIDGLVIKLNDNNLIQKLGVVGKTPRGWAAVKFAAQEVTTKIWQVAWQVGRTGKITPVAELEPVELNGTLVKRATLHNYKEFLEDNLAKNDTLVIRKAGEIIPEVIKVLENLKPENPEFFAAPKICPSCSSELKLSGTEVDLVCLNSENCPNQILGRLTYYTQRNLASITGLSDKILEKFCDLYGVKDVPDLYKLPYDKIRELEGFGEKSVENIQKSVEKARQIPAHKFLAGLAVEGVGIEGARLIVDYLFLRA
jgi:DNA ligase (NAD+)